LTTNSGAGRDSYSVTKRASCEAPRNSTERATGGGSVRGDVPDLGSSSVPLPACCTDHRRLGATWQKLWIRWPRPWARSTRGRSRDLPATAYSVTQSHARRQLRQLWTLCRGLQGSPLQKLGRFAGTSRNQIQTWRRFRTVTWVGGPSRVRHDTRCWGSALSPGGDPIRRMRIAVLVRSALAWAATRRVRCCAGRYLRRSREFADYAVGGGGYAAALD
jgi:hypothetical protein